MAYVVRSMTTTDFDHRFGGEPVTPFHIYLMPSHKRVRAFWSHKGDAAVFATPQEAEAEIVRAGLKDWSLTKPDNKSQVVPQNDDSIPTYWDIQELNEERLRLKKRLFDEGRAAWRAGTGRYENPHPADSIEAKAWLLSKRRLTPVRIDPVTGLVRFGPVPAKAAAPAEEEAWAVYLMRHSGRGRMVIDTVLACSEAEARGKAERQNPGYRVTRARNDL